MGAPGEPSILIGGDLAIGGLDIRKLPSLTLFPKKKFFFYRRDDEPSPSSWSGEFGSGLSKNWSVFWGDPEVADNIGDK
jgi:hypothetical protein